MSDATDETVNEGTGTAPDAAAAASSGDIAAQSAASSSDASLAASASASAAADDVETTDFHSAAPAASVTADIMLDSYAAGDDDDENAPLPDDDDDEPIDDYAADDPESHSVASASAAARAAKASAAADDILSEDEEEMAHNQFSTAFDLIDDMIAEITEAPGTLFNHDTARVSRSHLLEELDSLKRYLPVQLSQASSLMRTANLRLDEAQLKADSVISKANARAAEIIHTAEDRAEFLAGQQNVVAIATDRARRIVTDAQAKASKLTIGADQYCNDVMGELSRQLQHVTASVNEGVRVINERKAQAQGALDSLTAAQQAHDAQTQAQNASDGDEAQQG
ncbi:hypothetical protein PSRA_0702 [Pseudoscardovia radai]|uniref:Cell division protein n=1 Tax=Pseudoscardovia radai TaxID=987066 RepID=A0A261EZ60_9BIFI|nr:hypothetical protein [Pseudoscardovia radai]OZG52152.1 hypothetical protein PSRA_0702 [Pseudoscardovia radai]